MEERFVVDHMEGLSHRRGLVMVVLFLVFFFQAEDGIRDLTVTGVQTCALPISSANWRVRGGRGFRSSAGFRLRARSSAAICPAARVCSAKCRSASGRAEART